MIDRCTLTRSRAHSLTEEQVINDARRIAGVDEHSTYIPVDAREFAGRIFHTCYMGTENSSLETRRRAKDLAEAIGRSVLLLLSSCSLHPMLIG